jgi:hypothetical protein
VLNPPSPYLVDAVRGTSQYADVVNTVFNGWQNWLDTGGSYDDVQWVAITYAQAGQVDNAKHYYDIAASAWTTDYCGGGCECPALHNPHL